MRKQTLFGLVVIGALTAGAAAHVVAEGRDAKADAVMADALARRAQYFFVFFADLFGMREVYNTPGTVSPENWSIRVHSAYRGVHADRARSLRALHLPTALAMALRARGEAKHAALAERLARA